MAAVNKGVVSVAMDAGGEKFQFYKSGVVTECGTSLNHAVDVVGYGYDEETNLDYFLIKNSWGSSWGDNGYVKLWNKGDGKGTCGIQMYPSYPKPIEETDTTSPTFTPDESAPPKPTEKETEAPS
jgi:hypothetical protein